MLFQGRLPPKKLESHLLLFYVTMKMMNRFIHSHKLLSHSSLSGTLSVLLLCIMEYQFASSETKRLHSRRQATGPEICSQNLLNQNTSHSLLASSSEAERWRLIRAAVLFLSFPAAEKLLKLCRSLSYPEMRKSLNRRHAVLQRQLYWGRPIAC